jgi:hypothetical protein
MQDPRLFAISGTTVDALDPIGLKVPHIFYGLLRKPRGWALLTRRRLTTAMDPHEVQQRVLAAFQQPMMSLQAQALRTCQHTIAGRPPTGLTWDHQKPKKEYKLRYPECRGLRFCPERRMYYDRDEASARAIAGLRCLALQGKGRPSAFCPQTNSSGAVVKDAAARRLLEPVPATVHS